MHHVSSSSIIFQPFPWSARVSPHAASILKSFMMFHQFLSYFIVFQFHTVSSCVRISHHFSILSTHFVIVIIFHDFLYICVHTSEFQGCIGSPQNCQVSMSKATHVVDIVRQTAGTTIIAKHLFSPESSGSSATNCRRRRGSSPSHLCWRCKLSRN